MSLLNGCLFETILLITGREENERETCCKLKGIEYIYYKYLLYKIERFVDFSAIIKIDKLTCVIIHDKLTCVIIHDNLTCVDYHEAHYEFTALFSWGNRTIFYIINRTIPECLEI